MFVTLTQLVTLFAFTTHAVMGCCWHHSHAVLGCMPPAAAEVQLAEGCVATAHAGCSHRTTGRTQSACGHQPAATVVDADQPSSARLVPSDCGDSSHQPTHRCTSGRCNYIAAKLLTLDRSDAATLDGFVASYTLLRPSHSLQADKHRVGWPNFSSPSSCGERCADLQSWQI